METKKTTVSFPADLLLAMRKYMADQGMNLHSQSDLVIAALREYLEKRGIEIPNNNEKILFEVEQVGSQTT